VRRSDAVRDAVDRRRREVLARILAEPIDVPRMGAGKLALRAAEYRTRMATERCGGCGRGAGCRGRRGLGRGGPTARGGSEGGRLRLRETEQCVRMAESLSSVRFYATSTLALHLAVRGWPLVRGEEEWAKARWWCDIGEPEGLAYKIGVFEETAREAGWRVESPYTMVPPARPTPPASSARRI
jgi:hypothetical protein